MTTTQTLTADTIGRLAGTIPAGTWDRPKTARAALGYIRALPDATYDPATKTWTATVEGPRTIFDGSQFPSDSQNGLYEAVRHCHAAATPVELR